MPAAPTMNILTAARDLTFLVAVTVTNTDASDLHHEWINRKVLVCLG
jgi:hypothetical protein